MRTIMSGIQDKGVLNKERDREGGIEKEIGKGRERGREGVEEGKRGK